MGMFDNVTVKDGCPIPAGFVYQSKSFECSLGRVTIHADGRVHVKGYWGSETDGFLGEKYRDYARIYTGGGVGEVWREYEVHIVRGVVAEWREIEPDESDFAPWCSDAKKEAAE